MRPSTKSQGISTLTLLFCSWVVDSSAEKVTSNPTRKEYANTGIKIKSSAIKGADTKDKDDRRELLDPSEVPERKRAASADSKGDLKLPYESRWEQIFGQLEESLLAPSIAPSSSPSSSDESIIYGQVETDAPSSSPTKTISYLPGKLTNYQNGLLLSQGLQSRIIATSMEKVQLSDGTFSRYGFHGRPDGADVFADPDGGWIYVSNSERKEGDGGVGAIVFDKDGNVVDYKYLQTGTSYNCSGGKTPWNTWVSCEEKTDGKIWQVDPHGSRPPQETSISPNIGGYFEAFAYDIRNFDKPRFFVTEDSSYGALRRFTPSNPNWDDPWTILHGEGALEYLVLLPTNGDREDEEGTYYWTDDLETAKANARQFYMNTEGLDVYGHELYFTSKVQYSLFVLDLDGNTYKRLSTNQGLFDGQPDQIKRLIKDSNVQTSSTFDANVPEEIPLLYFCEEKGNFRGIHARDSNGWYYTILESNEYGRETTGLAFSPDGKHLYFSFQSEGIIFDVWREDGLPFYGKSLDVHYHHRSDGDEDEQDRGGRENWEL